MNEKDVLFVALGAAAIVITLLVGFATSWSVYTLLVGVLLAGAALASRFYLQLRADQETPPPLRQGRGSPDDPEQPATRVAVGPVALATATPEFRLTFSATVVWRPYRAEQPPSAPVPRTAADVARASGRAPTPGAAAEPTGLTPAPTADEPEPAPPAPGAPTGSATAPTADEPEPAHPAPAGPAAVPPSSGTEEPGPRSPAGDPPPEPARAGHIHVEQSAAAGPRRHADPGALATAAAVASAAETVLVTSAADSGETRQRLAEDLGWTRTDPTGTVLWCAQDVDLQPADPDDADRLRTLSTLRKQVQEWEQEREHERNLRRYLGEEVLTTTGSALVWWLARHLDDVRGAIGMIGDLSQLSAVSQDREHHPGRAASGPAAPQPVGVDGARGAGEDLAVTRDLLERLFPGSDDERTLFARDLAMVAERSGRSEYARHVRAMFGVPDLGGDPPDPGGGGPEEA